MNKDNKLFEKLMIAFKFGLKGSVAHRENKECDSNYFDRAMAVINRLYPKSSAWIDIDKEKPYPNQSVLVLLDYTKYLRGQSIEKANVHYAEKGQAYGGPNSLTGSGILRGIYFSIPSIVAPGIVTHWMPIEEIPESIMHICHDCDKPKIIYKDQLCKECHQWHTN